MELGSISRNFVDNLVVIIEREISVESIRNYCWDSSKVLLRLFVWDSQNNLERIFSSKYFRNQKASENLPEPLKNFNCDSGIA